MKVFVVCVLAVALIVEDVNGLTDAHKKTIKEHVLTTATDCMKTISLSVGEMASLHDKKIPDSANESCFVACMLKKRGIMDEAGMMSKEGVLAIGKKLFADAPEEIKHMEELLETCKSVNSAAVSDGVKGCDRAKLASECMKDHLKEFGLDF